MNKPYRGLILLLAVCLLFSGCAQMGAQAHNGVTVTTSLGGKPVLVGDADVKFPLVSSEKSLNIMSVSKDGIAQEDIYVWQQYEKMTGVNVNWTDVSKTDRAEVSYNALLNKQDIDLIMRCKISAFRLSQYGEKGLVLDLAKDDLLKQNAPNCWAFLQSHPEALASVMNPDGTIYALPQVNSGAELRVSRKIFINKHWLENLNLEVPTTTEEFHDMLLAFKEQDANGNGDTDDELPLCSQDWLSIEEAFYGAFGLGNRGVHNLTVDADEETGGVRLIAASEDYRDFLEYFNRLYSEGLIDSHTFAMDMDEWYSKAENDLIGVFCNTNLATLPADKIDNWVGIEEALEGPNGDKLWAAVRADFHSTGAAVIPAGCENPELVLHWLDYFWTDEGTLFYHMGVEGETFQVNSDGSYDYMPSLYEKMASENLSFDAVVAEISPYPGGGNPTVEIAPYFMGGEMAAVPAATARALFEYGPEEYWPSFTFTAEENEVIDTVKTDIKKYTDSATMEFVTGTKPLSQWDDYLAQLEKLDYRRILDTYQIALDRYTNLNTSLK